MNDEEVFKELMEDLVTNPTRKVCTVDEMEIAFIKFLDSDLYKNNVRESALVGTFSVHVLGMQHHRPRDIDLLVDIDSFKDFESSEWFDGYCSYDSGDTVYLQVDGVLINLFTISDYEFESPIKYHGVNVRPIFETFVYKFGYGRPKDEKYRSQLIQYISEFTKYNKPAVHNLETPASV